MFTQKKTYYMTKVIFMLKHSVKLRRYMYLVMWQHVLDGHVCCVLCRMRMSFYTAHNTDAALQSHSAQHTTHTPPFSLTLHCTQHTCRPTVSLCTAHNTHAALQSHSALHTTHMPPYSLTLHTTQHTHRSTTRCHITKFI